MSWNGKYPWQAPSPNNPSFFLPHVSFLPMGHPAPCPVSPRTTLHPHCQYLWSNIRDFIVAFFIRFGECGGWVGMGRRWRKGNGAISFILPSPFSTLFYHPYRPQRPMVRCKHEMASTILILEIRKYYRRSLMKRNVIWENLISFGLGGYQLSLS